VLHDLKEDMRGRAPGETPALIRAALPTDAHVEIVSDQHAGLLRAWELAQPGDRLIVVIDLVDEAVAMLHALEQSVAHDSECENPMMRALVEER
jgi:cyanophycin synthetase